MYVYVCVCSQSSLRQIRRVSAQITSHTHTHSQSFSFKFRSKFIPRYSHYLTAGGLYQAGDWLGRELCDWSLYIHICVCLCVYTCGFLTLMIQEGGTMTPAWAPSEHGSSIWCSMKHVTLLWNCERNKLLLMSVFIHHCTSEPQR